GLLDERPHPREHLAAPIAELLDPPVDQPRRSLLRFCCVRAGCALPRGCCRFLHAQALLEGTPPSCPRMRTSTSLPRVQGGKATNVRTRTRPARGPSRGRCYGPAASGRRSCS